MITRYFRTPVTRSAKRRKLAVTPSTEESSESARASLERDQDAGGEEGEASSVLELLPDDMLGKIFLGGYVNSIEVSKTTSCISKQFQRISREQVNMLDLRRCPNLLNGSIASIAARFPNLTELDLGYCDKLTDISPLRSLKLRILNLHGTGVTDEGIAQFLNDGAGSLLEEIDLSATKAERSNSITDATAQLIGTHCPNLRVLKFGWCRGITDEALRSLATLQHLEELDLSLAGISSDGCTVLSNFPALQRLDLSATDLGSEFLPDLLPYPQSKLTHLKLRFQKELDCKNLMILEECAMDLQHLNIENCGLTRNAVKKLILPLQRRGVEIEVERTLEVDGTF